MAGIYLDTSALGRVLLGEPGSSSVLAALDAYAQHISSRLLRLELRRLALRHDLLGNADQLLSAVALVPITDSVLDAAETIPPTGVATLDAIHLTTAIRLARADAIEAVMTYDARLAEGAEHHGIAVVAPA